MPGPEGGVVPEGAQVRDPPRCVVVRDLPSVSPQNSRPAPGTLIQVREFDRYQGKGIPDGKVSLSFRLTFQSPERTLTDDEVSAAMNTIVSALKSVHAAEQR